MAQGFFLRVGDKTTCGGQILTGDQSMQWYGVAGAREGDLVSCGKHSGSYRILGGVNNMWLEDRKHAGSLESFSSCPCKARFIPSIPDNYVPSNGNESSAYSEYQNNTKDNDDSDELTHWIECLLVDEQGKPLVEMPYTLKVGNDIVRHGVTSANGYFRQEKLPRTRATLTASAQTLTDEMENRLLRTLRGEAHSLVKLQAEANGYHYRYAVIGELCDKAPDIVRWEQAKFGLPYYHFPKEDEFNGLAFNNVHFNQCNVIEVCPFRAWSLVLNHTPDYDMVNAYNLGLMSLLVYKNEVMVDPDEVEDMREFIQTQDTTTSFFYQQCFDLSQAPEINDASVYPAIVTDVPFGARYRPAIFLDVQQADGVDKFEHDTQMFFVENDTQIIAAWRGTASARDALTDGTYRPIPCPENIISAGKAKVHKGFLEGYQCIEKYFPTKITDVKNKSANKQLFITGHSLGGALALLHASELRNNNPLLYTYGSPRVFTGSGVKALSSLNHFRHVNDADTVTSVPFDTNMDNWLFDAYGLLGTIFGFSWTLATLPTIPLQKTLPDIGEVYYHHGNTVSFFEARQIGDEQLRSHTGATLGHKRWRMNGSYKFYLVPSLANTLDKGLEKEQQSYVQSIKGDTDIINEIFPQWNNPTLDTIVTMATDHFMGIKYQAIINNQLLSALAPLKTPILVTSRQRFSQLIHHEDAYKLNAQRNMTFIELENVLHNSLAKNVNQNEAVIQALLRYKESTHEISLS
ncbi:lipase family protein [Providencia rustigianii]|uniref:lipase family protein n=1 Tax=Providencia rustigianii TaxID=158850 RepID=UPI000D8CF957|nr:PAAR domain-containing protein [Providencia rustigianii]SPY77461.1 Predicted lipase [Providencia rustigianii]